MPRTAQSVEENKSKAQSDSLSPVKRKRFPNNGRHPNSVKNLKPYPKGVSGNPGGKPGKDVAALLCRQAIELNAEEIYKGIAKRLMNGEPYLFQVASDRGYGKLKEHIEVTNADDLGSRLAAGRNRAKKTKHE